MTAYELANELQDLHGLYCEDASRAILYASSGDDYAEAAARVAGAYQAEMATYL